MNALCEWLVWAACAAVLATPATWLVALAGALCLWLIGLGFWLGAR